MAKKIKDAAPGQSEAHSVKSDSSIEAQDNLEALSMPEKATKKTPSKAKTLKNMKSGSKASKSSSKNSSDLSESENLASELLAQLPKEKRLKSPLLNLAVITILFAIIISLVSIIFPFRDVVSVNSDVIETLSVEVTISAPQFITAPAISACQGSGRLAGMTKAKIYLAAEDGSWKVNSVLGSGQLNSDGDCVYTPEIETPETFDGGAVKARVDFSFGSSSTYTVDGYSIALDINLN